jgi:16S rRNA (uracil1498-N3)-methyltransferase
MPKGEKMEFVLQKGTELGVAEFWPFGAARSVPILDEDERMAARAERWRKIARQAAAQCGRADVPVVHAIGELATAIDYGTANSRCFMLDEAPEVESLRQALERESLAGQDEAEVRVMVVVGPEGGWTEREREWADRYGVERVGLGRLVLRTETAALAAVTILQWVSGDLG